MVFGFYGNPLSVANSKIQGNVEQLSGSSSRSLNFFFFFLEIRSVVILFNVRILERVENTSVVVPVFAGSTRQYTYSICRSIQRLYDSPYIFHPPYRRRSLSTLWWFPRWVVVYRVRFIRRGEKYNPGRCFRCKIFQTRDIDVFFFYVFFCYSSSLLHACSIIPEACIFLSWWDGTMESSKQKTRTNKVEYFSWYFEIPKMSSIFNTEVGVASSSILTSLPIFLGGNQATYSQRNFNIQRVRIWV